MARKRVTEPQLGSWEEVDGCLKQIADAENEIKSIEADMNKRIAEIKKTAEEEAKQHKETIKQNEGKLRNIPRHTGMSLPGRADPHVRKGGFPDQHEAPAAVRR